VLLINKQKYKEISDNDLLLKYRKTKRKLIIEEIFNRYAQLIYGVCLKYSNTYSVCKDVLITIIEILMKEASVKEIKNLKSWLFIVTRNECFKNNREIQKVQYNSIDECNKDLYYEKKEEESMYSDAILLSTIEELKEEQKQCLKLFYFEKKSYNEISELTNYDVKKVKSYIQNAKRNLKIILSKKEKSNETL
jgi:RNA polymerase sigma-70 factor (ECF subfamily)